MRAGAGLAAAPAVLGGALAVVVILDPRITRDVRRSLYPKKMTADDEKMDPSESKWES
jgi:hypothetical protein